MELDVDALLPHTMWKFYDAVCEYCPEAVARVKARWAQQNQEEPRVAANPAPKKKNKPMSKVEQERKIALLREKMQSFKGAGSASQEPIESVEQHTQEESSGDESSDSEEE